MGSRQELSWVAVRATLKVAAKGDGRRNENDSKKVAAIER
jgi:hypothetical protein